MAFPHPKSRKDHYRNEYIPRRESVLRNVLKRTIDIANYRNGKDDVNPAKNRTLHALAHDSPLTILSRPVGGSTPNCFAYSAFNRCQPANFIASPPAMRPMGVPPRR